MVLPVDMIRVFVTQDSVFGETRVNIGVPGAAVTNVRVHNAISAFFLSFFGKIEKIEGRDEKTKEMKTFYVNRNSILNKSPNKTKIESETGNNLVKSVLKQIKEKNSNQITDALKERLSSFTVEDAESFMVFVLERSSHNVQNLVREVVNEKKKMPMTPALQTEAINKFLAEPEAFEITKLYFNTQPHQEPINKEQAPKKNESTVAVEPSPQKIDKNDALTDIELITKLDRNQLIDAGNQALVDQKDVLVIRYSKLL